MAVSSVRKDCCSAAKSRTEVDFRVITYGWLVKPKGIAVKTWKRVQARSNKNVKVRTH